MPPGSTCLPLPILRPPICSVGCGEVLGMFALSCDEHPAELPRRRSPPSSWHPSRVSGDTRVVYCELVPPHKGRPLAMTSILLSSWRSRCSRLRSTRRVFVVTRAPASLHMRAAARSMAPPVLAKVQTAHKPRGGRQEGLECDGTGRSGQIRAVAIGGAAREAGGRGGSGSCCHCGMGLW